MAKSVDVVLLRKRQIWKRRMIKFLILLAIVGVCVLIYVKRDVWFPKLEGIGSRYQNVTRNEDAIADGEFELNVSGGVNYQANFINNNLFILCDKYLYIYGADGTLKDSRQHAYSNAVMKINGTRSLVYSSGGTSFRIDSTNKMIFEETMDQPILFGALSPDGYVAVVTESETYSCKLSIYNADGKLIYTRECIDRLSDVCFSGNGCIFSTISASDAELITTLQYITFDSNEVHWETAPLSTLCMKVCALPDGGALVIGDTQAAYYSSTGALSGSYDYSAELLDYAFVDGKAAVLLKNEERRQSVLMLFPDKATAPSMVQFDNISKSVIVHEDMAYLLGGGRIRSFSFSGEEIDNIGITDAYERILKYGKYFYLLGYDTIHRVTAG